MEDTMDSMDAIELGRHIQAFVDNWAPKERKDAFWENLRVLLDEVSAFTLKVKLVPAQVPEALVSRKSMKPKASPDQVAEILQMHANGFSNKEIANYFGINGQSVNGIVATSRNIGQIQKAK